jgi:RimJ/RimL family protein N-acetyltransferase
VLRRWRLGDLEPFADMHGDPEVTEFLPGGPSLEETRRLIDGFERGFDEHGYGFWALELTGEAQLIGMAGIADVHPELPFAPAVEVGWRLARPFWGQGLATEAATECVRFAFADRQIESLLAYTARGNVRSRRVMERLCMRRDEHADFVHPALDAEHRLAAHVLYRLDAATWRIRSSVVRALHEHRGT